MSARSLNRVSLIGNLTRDPELRYTPQGTAVCTFGLATNRQWTTDTGEKREETEFHRIVSWNKLAEICSQLLTKGRKAYVEGRLSTRTFTASDGNQRTVTEIVIDNMILLDSRRPVTAETPVEEVKVEETETPPQTPSVVSPPPPTTDELVKKPKKGKAAKEEEKEPKEAPEAEAINPDEIPF